MIVPFSRIATDPLQEVAAKVATLIIRSDPQTWVFRTHDNNLRIRISQQIQNAIRPLVRDEVVPEVADQILIRYKYKFSEKTREEQDNPEIIPRQHIEALVIRTLRDEGLGSHYLERIIDEPFPKQLEELRIRIEDFITRCFRTFNRYSFFETQYSEVGRAQMKPLQKLEKLVDGFTTVQHGEPDRYVPIFDLYPEFRTMPFYRSFVEESKRLIRDIMIFQGMSSESYTQYFTDQPDSNAFLELLIFYQELLETDPDKGEQLRRKYSSVKKYSGLSTETDRELFEQRIDLEREIFFVVVRGPVPLPHWIRINWGMMPDRLYFKPGRILTLLRNLINSVSPRPLFHEEADTSYFHSHLFEKEEVPSYLERLKSSVPFRDLVLKVLKLQGIDPDLELYEKFGAAYWLLEIHNLLQEWTQNETWQHRTPPENPESGEEMIRDRFYVENKHAKIIRDDSKYFVVQPLLSDAYRFYTYGTMYPNLFYRGPCYVTFFKKGKIYDSEYFESFLVYASGNILDTGGEEVSPKWFFEQFPDLEPTFEKVIPNFSQVMEQSAKAYEENFHW